MPVYWPMTRQNVMSLSARKGLGTLSLATLRMTVIIKDGPQVPRLQKSPNIHQAFLPQYLGLETFHLLYF
jgi:hypothetical protein